ncbi:sulfatase family protein [Phytoactinopolyspora halotolerans]|uniref:Sulfatase-like hydrolase/transferase n=1 Tax=Phytoactinopolyspora halotolerans TaxID=1981512 RepID=A0A6L9SG30_9ACTN|nr:sulfatase-like hydrolase/transferase [Phytoactinopolyspora halotolerans]NEE03392.1 sulfatase-like hydrolase/transferase [Phytoactinopolyspora halotolerans]
MKRPNILLITTDQQHWNTIGAFNPELRTPSLDRLVAEGTTFSRAYCPNPTCTPTRASIITGKYPSQHGAWTLGTKLPESETTIGQLLADGGYRSGLIGKAHFQPLHSTAEYRSVESYPTLQDLDFWRKFHGLYYGFDHVEMLRNHVNEAHVGQHYALWLEEQGATDWRRYFSPPTGTMDKPDGFRWDIPEELHYNTWLAERASSFIADSVRDDQPFFCWASFPDPHPPYLVPEPWASMYHPDDLTIPEPVPGEHDRNPPHFGLTQQDDPDFADWHESGFAVHGLRSHRLGDDERRRLVAAYYGMVSFTDAYIGAILDELDRRGVADNTIVVFSTDHGHFFGQHGLQHKGPFMYEDMVRVPMLVRYPGKVPAGRVSPAIQSLVDLAPTFLDLAGFDTPATMTGVNQSDTWLGRRDAVRDHAICEHHHEPTRVNLRTYISERYKLTVYYRQTYGELFDLEADPGELHNLWDDPDHADLKSRLLLEYAWAELGKEPMWMPRIASA